MPLKIYRPPVESRFVHPAPVSGLKCCGHTQLTGWRCTRTVGHTGRHEAGMNDGDGIARPEFIAASW